MPAAIAAKAALKHGEFEAMDWPPVIHGVLPGTRRVYYIGMTRRGAAPSWWLVASPEAALTNLRRGASISSKGHEPSVGEL